MGLKAVVADVLEFLRGAEEDGPVVEVKGDPGDGDVFTSQHTAPPGEDSHPVPQDQKVCVPAEGEGRWIVVGYLDTVNAGEAADGEKRFYGRDPSDGSIQCVIWLKADGSIFLSNANGSLTLGTDGNLTATGDLRVDGDVKAGGEVTANEGTGTDVGLSTHVHPHAMGPTQAPTPNT